jgi:hypothetical protein
MYFFYTKLSFTEFILRAQFAILFPLTNLYKSFGCIDVETDSSNISPALRAAITTSLQKYLGASPR